MIIENKVIKIKNKRINELEHQVDFLSSTLKFYQSMCNFLNCCLQNKGFVDYSFNFDIDLDIKL